MLACRIRENMLIKGLVFEGKEFKISQYADDIVLLLADIISVKQSINTIRNFSKVAGLLLNLDKTEGLLLGNLAQSKITSCENIKFSDSPIKCLGIYIGKDKQSCETLNWSGKLSQFESLLNIWQKRNLNIFGKVTVMNNLCFPKIMYACTVLPVPKHIFHKIEHLLNKFVWHGKSQINRKCTINTIENGGLNIIDLRSKIQSLKVTWLLRWIKNPLWKPVADAFLTKIRCCFPVLFAVNIKKLEDFPVLLNMTSFYKETWLSYYTYKRVKLVQQMKDFDFLSQVLWENHNFKFQSKCLSFQIYLHKRYI